MTRAALASARRLAGLGLAGGRLYIVRHGEDLLLAVGKRMRFPWSPLAAGSRASVPVACPCRHPPPPVPPPPPPKPPPPKPPPPKPPVPVPAPVVVVRRRAARLGGDDALACIQAREHDVIRAVGESQHDWLDDPLACHLFEDDTGRLPGSCRGGGRRAPSKREPAICAAWSRAWRRAAAVTTAGARVGDGAGGNQHSALRRGGPMVTLAVMLGKSCAPLRLEALTLIMTG